MPATIAVITGPTATGKTKLGVILAKEIGGEVVSADSMQIYRGMDIGTAKPAPGETDEVSHHMIDVAEPWENYSVARYVREASICVNEIISRGKLPIIVGGTGLYIDSLISGRSFAAIPEDSTLRHEISSRYDNLGGEALLIELSRFDPERASKLQLADKKRIVRALEVYYLTGRSLTEHDEETKKLPPRYNALITALSFSDRTRLYERIDSRVDDMIKAGLVEEVKLLIDSGVPENCTAMQAIGYKETALFINGRISLKEAVQMIKQESRRYAKRQLTWLRRNPEIQWIFWENYPDYDFARRKLTDFLFVNGIK